MRARSEAADFIQAEMPHAQIFMTHRDIIRFAVENAADDGLYLEFGVATGNTLREIASAAPTKKVVYGFDSFKGLPGDWSGHVETTGAFKQNRVPKVPFNATLVPGLFSETLPTFMDKNNGPISLPKKLPRLEALFKPTILKIQNKEIMIINSKKYLIIFI